MIGVWMSAYTSIIMNCYLKRPYIEMTTLQKKVFMRCSLSLSCVPTKICHRCWKTGRHAGGGRHLERRMERRVERVEVEGGEGGGPLWQTPWAAIPTTQGPNLCFSWKTLFFWLVNKLYICSSDGGGLDTWTFDIFVMCENFCTVDIPTIKKLHI